MLYYARQQAAHMKFSLPWHSVTFVSCSADSFCPFDLGERFPPENSTICSACAGHDSSTHSCTWLTACLVWGDVTMPPGLPPCPCVSPSHTSIHLGAIRLQGKGRQGQNCEGFSALLCPAAASTHRVHLMFGCCLANKLH